MYSTKVELLRQNLNKRNSIDLTEIKRVYGTNYLELDGEFLFGELPCLEDSEKSIENQLKDEREIYSKILNELDSRTFLTSDRVSDLKARNFLTVKMTDFTRYHFGTTNIRASIVRPLFLYKCKHVIDRINYDLTINEPYEVEKPNHFRFIDLTKKIKRETGIKEGLTEIAIGLCDSDKSTFLLWLNNLIMFNKLYKYYESGCNFGTYFDSDVSRVDHTSKRLKH